MTKKTKKLVSRPKKGNLRIASTVPWMKAKTDTPTYENLPSITNLKLTVDDFRWRKHLESKSKTDELKQKEYTEKQVQAAKNTRTWRSDVADIMHGLGEAALASNPYTATSYFGAKALDNAFRNGITPETVVNAGYAALPWMHVLAPIIQSGVLKGALFMTSNLTGKWTPFFGREYRLNPNIIGVNGGGIQSRPISYGYNREKVAKAASQEFGLDMSIRRPILYRMANEDNILADALDLVKSGKSETRFGTGNRTMIEPEPHSVLTGTYLDLKTKLPIVRGVGLLGTKPVPVTPLEGSYKTSGRFGNMTSVTDALEGAGKYGFRNYSEIEDYLNTLGLNNSLLKYAKDVISRLKSFDSQIQFGTETTQGLIPKNMRNTPEFLQYIKDHLELSDILSGNLNWGAKNLRVIFNAPKSRSIITGESDNPGFATRTANINMPLKDFSGNEFKQFMERGVPKFTWPNGMVVEDYLAKYNNSPEFLRIILSSKNNPMVQFPLHFRGTGPNPIPGMTTMQVSGVKPTLRKGGIINVLKLKIFNK